MANPWVEWFGVLAIEGDPTEDGRLIEAGALVHPDRAPVPVLRPKLRPDGEWAAMDLAGYIGEWTRRGSVIVGRGHGAVSKRQLVAVDLSNMDGSHWVAEGSWIVTSATIAGVTLTDNPCWLGRAYIEPVSGSLCSNAQHLISRQLGCPACYPVVDA